MNKIFKKSRSVSPSFEIPKICLPRQKKSIDDALDNVEPDLSATLKVPNSEPRIRSSSFDSSTLKQDSLEVPNKHGRRCHSFDSACTEQLSHCSSEENISDKEPVYKGLKMPRYQKHRSSFEIPRLCIHCIHMETKAKEMSKFEETVDKSYPKQFLFEDDIDSDEISITSSTSYTTTSSESLSDQGDFYYLTNSEDEGNESDCDDEDFYIDNEDDSSRDNDIPRLEHFDSKEDEVYVNAVTLAVPVIKQHRSSSMDERILKGPESQIQRQASFDEGCLLDVPVQVRSSSVDVNLPTEQETRYKAIPHSDKSR